MIQIQITANFRNDDHKITLDILEREDASDLEREFAQYVQSLHLGIFEQIPEVELTMIERCPECGMAHEPGKNTLCSR